MGDLYSEYNNYGNLIQSLGIVFYVLGMFFHFVADAQKFFTLKYRKPRKLITEGLFRYTRNPNYLGEVMIYVGYAFEWIYVHYHTLHGRMDASIFTKHVT